MDVSDLTAWDLLSAWTRLLRETLSGKKLHIDPDERPLRHYVEDLVAELKSRREISLAELVRHAVERGNAGKAQVIGTFCALLELMKLGVARAWQPDRRGDITIVLRDDLGSDVDDVVRNSGFDDERVEETPERPLPLEPGLFEGAYGTEELPEGDQRPPPV